MNHFHIIFFIFQKQLNQLKHLVIITVHYEMTKVGFKNEQNILLMNFILTTIRTVFNSYDKI